MISSVHNPEVKRLVRLREEAKLRHNEGSVLVTGFKQIREIAQKTTPLQVFVEDLADALPGIKSTQVSHAVLKKITGLPSPEPIVAEFLMPAPSNLAEKSSVLVLDGIQDPGNMGTLLRTALALKWEGVFFLPGCVDAFNEKALRSSRGALFWLPWFSGSFDQLESLRKQGNFVSYVADIKGKELSSFKREKNILLVLGSESKGIGEQLESFGQKITIPMNAECESLNVAIAGAILMYYLK